MGRRVLLLLVVAMMTVMMSVGTALAFNGGGDGGGFGGGAGGAGGAGGQVVKHDKFDRYYDDRYHHDRYYYDVCWDKWHGKWYSYYC